MPSTYRRVALLTGLLMLGFSAEALALRCGSDLVDVGDPAYELRAACGVPDYVLPLYGYGHGPGYGGDELWYYNFGPSSLMREVRIRDGRVEDIRTPGRGFRKREKTGPCRPLDVDEGMTGFELVVKCGEPVQREARRLLRYERHKGVVYGRRWVWVEDWYYRFGDRYIDRRVRLVDGRVVEVDTVD